MAWSTTDRREIRFAVVSDIHTGHRRTKTEHILSNLTTHIANDRFMASIDILFIAGDFYDELLAAPSQEHSLIDQWIGRLLKHAHRHKVCVRVLEGTISHDRGQSISFVTINEVLQQDGMGADLKYVDTLSIEYMEKFGIHVLYVPDEWRPNNQDTLDEVRQLLRANNLNQVDIAIMHGCFPHQLPQGLDHVPVHDDVAYSEIVKSLIFIGHHHTNTVSGKIHAQGSFDRLGHGEEEPKGFYRATLAPDGTYTVEFIENKNAAQYISIECDADEMVDNLMAIDAVAKKTPSGAHMRIVAHHNSPIHANMAVIKERWPGYTWTVKVTGKEKAKDPQIVNHKLIYVPVVLDRLNLKPALLERLKQRGYDSVQIARCEEQLSQFTGA